MSENSNSDDNSEKVEIIQKKESSRGQKFNIINEAETSNKIFVKSKATDESQEKLSSLEE